MGKHVTRSHETHLLRVEIRFVVFIYGITKPFLAPFTALVGTPKSGGTILEVTTLIGTSDDVPSAPRLTSLIALAATKWEPR